MKRWKLYVTIKWSPILILLNTSILNGIGMVGLEFHIRMAVEAMRLKVNMISLMRKAVRYYRGGPQTVVYTEVSETLTFLELTNWKFKGLKVQKSLQNIQINESLKCLLFNQKINKNVFINTETTAYTKFKKGRKT